MTGGDAVTARAAGPRLPELLMPGEVAKIFRVDPKTVQRWAAKGVIPSTLTPGGHRRFRRADIEEIVRRSRIERTQQKERKGNG